MSIGAPHPLHPNATPEIPHARTNAASERERREEDHRDELREQHLPARDGPREEERDGALGELGRDEVGAEDGDEERDEQDAADARERAGEDRAR